MKKVFLFCLLLLCLTGCKSYYLNKYCKPFTHEHSEASDSSFADHKETTNTTTDPGEKQTIYLQSPCDDSGKIKPVNIKSKKGRQTLNVQSDGAGGLKIDCENDSIVNSLREVISQRDRTIKKLEKSNTVAIKEDKPGTFGMIWQGAKNAFALLGFFTFVWFAIKIAVRVLSSGVIRL